MGLPVFLLTLGIMVGVGVNNAHAIGHYDIPGTYEGCIVCHDFIDGVYEPDVPGTANLRWIRDEITWDGSTYTGVTYTCDPSEGPCTDGTLADGVDADLDGPCEVCHDATTVHYHNNTGDAVQHEDGTDCTICHPHFGDDITNFFQATFKGSQSHDTHLTDLKGPRFDLVYGQDQCIQCHDGGNYSQFADGQPIETTTVCDPCHSPGGVFDGSAEAKAKWVDAVYEENGEDLQAGNENWCATCHDGGTSVIHGVSAPDVAGDNSTWGYNVNGHGNYSVFCEDCHALAVFHTDGKQRSYDADSTNPDETYRKGYRLNDDMIVPRAGETAPAAFRLCLNCHSYTDVTGDETSNFRDDAKGMQFHDLHLDDFGSLDNYADTDFDGTTDSAMTCISCHNVHGPNDSGAMVRHGELISTPGTTDKVPALDFHWYLSDQTTETMDVNESFYGSLICGVDPGGLSTNHVCTGCHRDAPPSDPLFWYRDVGTGPTGMTLDAVYTSDTSDTPRTSFAPGETFRAHVEFTVATGGGGNYFIQIANSGVGNLASMPGTDWVYALSKEGQVPSGSYDIWWEGPIPSYAGSPDPGDPAILLIRISAYDVATGTLVDQYEESWDFSVIAP